MVELLDTQRKRPVGNGTQSKITGGRSAVDSTASTDESGLLPPCCFRAYLDGRSTGHAEGYAQGRADHIAEYWAKTQQIVRNAARSIDTTEARRKADAGVSQ